MNTNINTNEYSIFWLPFMGGSFRLDFWDEKEIKRGFRVPGQRARLGSPLLLLSLPTLL